MSAVLNDLEKEFVERKREALENLLAECEDSQQEFFFRIYGPTEDISEDKLKDAIAICERTITANLIKIF